MNKLKVLIAIPILLNIYCSIGYFQIRDLNNYRVIAIKSLRNEDIGITIKNEKINLDGKLYKIPMLTTIDNSAFGGLKFPIETYLPVGNNLIPFAANEYISILYSDSVYIMSGVLGHDIVLKVGNRKIPFHAARNTPESKKYRGEFQIRFHKNGSISEAYIGPQDTTFIIGLNKVKLRGKTPIDFYETGEINKIYIEDSTELVVGQNLIPFYDHVCFYQSGQIFDSNIKGKISVKVGNRTLTFVDSGGYYATNRFDMDDGNISFNRNGSVHSAILNDSTKFELFAKQIILTPQGVYFDSLGRLEIFVNTNEILRYKTDVPMLKFDDEFYANDTICPDYSNGTPPEDLPDDLSENFRLQIGGNNLLFTKSQKYRQDNIIYSNIVPNQKVKIGDNEFNIYSLASVDGTGQLFHKNGTIKGVILQRDIELKVGSKKIKFLHKSDVNKNADVGFYCDGSISFGYIGQDILDTITNEKPEYYFYKNNQVKIKGNQIVYFKKNGSVKYSVDYYKYLIMEYITDVYSPEFIKDN